MSGNGRGNMRPTSRSPPFLVVGLLIATCIFAFNYWGLSSKNKDLTNELESLQADFRSVSDKHLAVEKRASHLSSQTAEFQSMVSKLQTSATEKDNKVSMLLGEVNSLNSQLEQVRDEGQSKMQHMEDEKKSVLEDLADVKRELEDERRKVVVCDKNMCKDVVRDIMKAMLDSVGKTKVMAALSSSHGDVLSLIDDLLKTATDPVVQQYQGNVQLPFQGDVNRQPPVGQVGLPAQGGEAGHNANMGPNAIMGPNANMGQNLNVGQNADEGQNPNAGQNLNAAQNPEVGQNPNAGQDLMLDQNGNLAQDSNVVQMQQPGDQGQVVASQDQLLGILKQQPRDADLNHPQNVAPQPQDGDGKPEEEEEKGGEQEIVAQNIPQREVEEPALPNEEDHQRLQDLNAARAQEDLNAAPAQEDLNAAPARMDLPEDEIDMQAKANHVARLRNPDDNLHDQLQDLSRDQVDERGNENLRDMVRMEMEEHGQDKDRKDLDREEMEEEEEDRREDERDFDEENEPVEAREEQGLRAIWQRLIGHRVAGTAEQGDHLPPGPADREESGRPWRFSDTNQQEEEDDLQDEFEMEPNDWGDQRNTDPFSLPGREEKTSMEQDGLPPNGKNQDSPDWTNEELEGDEEVDDRGAGNADDDVDQDEELEADEDFFDNFGDVAEGGRAHGDGAGDRDEDVV